MPAAIACPCGRPRAYRLCCQPLHRGAPGGRPEDVMRARYAAYVLGKVGYLIDSTTPGGPADRRGQGDWAAELTEACARMKLVGLQVLDAPAPHGTSGTVHFRFRAEVHGAISTFEERSAFVQHQGRWTYSGTASDGPAHDT